MIKAVIMSENTPQIEVIWEPGVLGSERIRQLTTEYDVKIPSYLKKDTATLKDFNRFLETRVVPKERYDLDDVLKKYGLKFYNPLQMCMKSYGRSKVDDLWIDFNDSGLTWEQVSIR